jgi:hypothetical protein
MDPSSGKWVAAVEVVHVRCAGMDISKKDAKVCARVAGAGRRKTTGTVSAWGRRRTRSWPCASTWFLSR